MNFKTKVQDYFTKNGVTVSRIEQQGDTESIVCHINKSDNNKVTSIQKQMEKDLDVTIVLSDSYNMNVVIVESNDLE